MSVRAGYYRCIRDHDEVVSGQLVYAVQGEPADKVDVLFASHHYIYSLDEFEPVFEFAPEGAAEHQDQINKLMQEIDQTEVGFGGLTEKMIEFQPHVAGGELAGDSALVPQNTPHTPATIKKAVAKVRNTIAKTKRALDLKRQQLSDLIEAKSAALQLRVGEMNRLVSKANEAIWTINLYMGKNEEIHRLAKGEVAPKEEPITLRQRVLYMDEECVALPERQGIDVGQLEIFDEWLMEGDNLNRLLPEAKGIVCLHARGKKKDYADPWVSAQMNEANLRYTYFLIRNGENVYRIYADIALGMVMFPNAREYENLFQKTEFDWSTHSSRTKPIRPGDSEYMEAMEKVEEKQRHYLRVLLILQGLLDRTDVFKPLPVERINICNQADYYEFLRFIYETGEAVLDDGKPSFRSWLTSVNKSIDVGHRIAGAFNSYDAHIHGESDGGHRYGVRIYPQNAESPNSEVLHTIQRMESERHGADHYYFSYDRGEIWDPYDGLRSCLTRGSCYICRSDTWIIDFDATEVADIEYYLTSRKGKREYEIMVPVLELVLELKAKEQEEEKPFCQLLAAQISRAHSIDLAVAIDVVPELVKWWKLKNRTHRALTSDDSKALSMIVTEFGIRQKRESERAALALRHESVVAAIRQVAEPVLVAHKSGNKYVALVPHNAENVWVREQTWTLNRTTGAVYMNTEKAWKLVDKRHERWAIVYEAERWRSWIINPRPSTVLTDPELGDLIDRAFDIQRAEFEKEQSDKERFFESSGRRGWGGHRDRRRPQRFLPLAGGISEEGSLSIWFSDQGPILPESRLFSRRPCSSIIEIATVDYKRKKVGVKCYVRSTSIVSETPWDDKGEDKRFPESTYRFLRYFEENIERLCAEKQSAKELKKSAELVGKSVDHVSRAAAKYAQEKQEQAYFAEFLADHGDLELWDDYKEELEFSSICTHQIWIACCLLAERGIEVCGLTLEAIFERAMPFGLLSNKKDFENNYSEIDPNIPMDFVVPPPPENSEDEEEWDEE